MPISPTLADFAAPLPGCCRGAVVRRVRAAPQCRDRRRQYPAADALRLFLRHRERLQQTRSRLGLRRPRAARPGMHAIFGWSEQLHRDASVRFLRTSGRPGRRCRNRGTEPDGARCRSKHFTGCPPTHRTVRRVLEPGEMIVAVRLPAEAARFAAHARYLKVARAYLLCFCRRFRRGRFAHRGRNVIARGAHRARRRRIEAVACARGGANPARRARPMPSALSSCRRGRARGREALRRQRLQDRACAP